MSTHGPGKGKRLVTIALSAALTEQIEAIARSEDRSRSYIIRRLIVQALAKQEGAK